MSFRITSSDLCGSTLKQNKQLFNRGGVRKDDFVTISTIGDGAFSSVNLVKKVTGKDKGKYYAMKSQGISRSTDRLKNNRLLLYEELKVYDAIKGSTFLTQLIYSFQYNMQVNFVLEWYEGGNLYELIKRTEEFSEEGVKFCGAELTLGIEELHRRRIIHRDLKPENILLTWDGHLSITDFGLSHLFGENEAETLDETAGTLVFRAPEMFDYPLSYSYPVDWWSLGCILVELMSGENPFSGKSEEESSYSSTADRVKYNDPEVPNNISLIMKVFVLGLLDKDPETRLGSNGAKYVKEHCFFDNINWSNIAEKAVQPPWANSSSSQCSEEENKSAKAQVKLATEEAPSTSKANQSTEQQVTVSKSDQIKRKKPDDYEDREIKKIKSRLSA